MDGRLAAIARAVAGAQAFAGSVAADHGRHRAERRKLRRRLKLPAASPPARSAAAAEVSLPALREAQQQLVDAHAEGLPALKDAGGVDLLARHLVDASRHLTVVDLWIEAEEERG